MKACRAKLFMNGRSQAVRIPVPYRYQNIKELKISKQGNRLILEPIYPSWDSLIAALDQLPEGFDLPRSPVDLSKKELF